LRPDEYWAIAYKRNLIKMSTLSRRIGAEMVLVSLPGLCRPAALGTPEYSLIVENTRANPASFPYWVRMKQFTASTLQEVAGAEGVEMIDVSDYFERFSNADRLRLFVDEMHTTKDGSEQIANAIYAYLAARP
jgi:lysophospholipase L1-like esterase